MKPSALPNAAAITNEAFRPGRVRRFAHATLSVAICAGLLPAPMAFAQTKRSKTASPVAGDPPASAPGAGTPSSIPAPPPRMRGEAVTLNFVNADIEGVTRAMAAILRQQFLVDPRVRGNITLYSEEPLSPRDAYYNFLAALRGLGFTVVESGGIYKVVPEADAKLLAGTVSIGDVSRRGDQIITQIFKLNYENANNLVPVLRPLINPNNTINANPGNNSLVITDYADNLQRIAKIIATMDTPATGDIEVIPMRYAVAGDVAALIQKLADTAGGTGTPGVPAGAATGVTPSILVDSRSNSLIVRSPNAARLASIRSLVDKLDRAPEGSAANGNIWVVHLKNADSVKLAAVLRAAFAAGSGNAGGFNSGGASTAPTAAAPTGNAGGAAQPVTPSGGPSTGGFIQADPSTNSLIVTAPEPLYRQVRAMIDQLDARRAQVYIESMIVEVSGGNTADFGFQWQGLIGRNGDSNGVVAGTNFGTTGNLLSNTLNQLGASTSGVSLGEGLNIGLVHNYFGTYGLAAIARLLQTQTNTNIVSTPNLITLDNEEAKIIVGSNVPFVTGQYTSTGGSGALSNPFQTIERKDVGITLRIRPQISENGAVRMTIFQESSSLSTDVAPGTTNAGPTTNKRSIESNVVVDDGSIIVLGGLIEDRYSETKSKIPLLGDIPYLGALFRSENRTKNRTNLMVFLRPIVMRDTGSTDRLSLDRYDLIRSAQKDAQPTPSVLVPVNDSPVIPPLRRLEDSSVPVAVPPSSPGTAPPGLNQNRPSPRSKDDPDTPVPRTGPANAPTGARPASGPTVIEIVPIPRATIVETTPAPR